MSRSDSRPPRPLTCSDVRFAEVEFPAVFRPRMVIEFSEGLSLLLEDRAAIPLAAEFIAVFRGLHAEKGGRPC
jgi:hypothetical protein